MYIHQMNLLLLFGNTVMVLEKVSPLFILPGSVFKCSASREESLLSVVSHPLSPGICPRYYQRCPHHTLNRVCYNVGVIGQKISWHYFNDTFIV